MCLFFSHGSQTKLPCGCICWAPLMGKEGSPSLWGKKKKRKEKKPWFDHFYLQFPFFLWNDLKLVTRIKRWIKSFALLFSFTFSRSHSTPPSISPLLMEKKPLGICAAPLRAVVIWKEKATFLRGRVKAFTQIHWEQTDGDWTGVVVVPTGVWAHYISVILVFQLCHFLANEAIISIASIKWNTKYLLDTFRP